MENLRVVTAVIAATSLGIACDEFELGPVLTLSPEVLDRTAHQPPTVSEHMLDHFTHGMHMRDAVIAGDLNAIREHARWFAHDHFSAGNLPAHWQPHVEAMQVAADNALHAEELRFAAGAVAELAAACGQCHREFGGPTYVVGTPPKTASGIGAQMARHRWAADRMWAALAMPSDEAWYRATEVLSVAPLLPKHLTDANPAAAEVRALARRLHDMAGGLREEQDLEARITAYSRFIATCASCHRHWREREDSR